MKMSIEERLLINTAIEKLINKADPASVYAKTIIEFGTGMRGSDPIAKVKCTIGASDDESITGCSPGHGEITTSDTSDEEEVQCETAGEYKERVGHYKLWKHVDGLLFIQHWKGETELNIVYGIGKYVPLYYLYYDAETLEPLGFGITHMEKQIGFKFFNRSLFRFRFLGEPIYGISPWSQKK